MNYFGESIRKFRESMKWSQEKFADKIVERMQAFGKDLNYTNRSISMWESGDRLPSLEVMIVVSDLTGCSIDNLLKSEVEEFKAEEKKIIRQAAAEENPAAGPLIEISNGAETFFVDGDGVLEPYTNGQAKELFEDLRNWRLNESSVIDLPAYCVLDDKTLYNIADVVPYKTNLLWLVQGLGQVKIETYGEKIVEVVKNFLKKHDVRKILYGSSAIAASDRTESALGYLGLLNYFGRRSKKSTKNKENKTLTANEINKNCITAAPVPIAEFVSGFNLSDIKKEKRVRNAIMAWLMREGLAEEYAGQNGKVCKVASAKGQDLGLITEKKINAAGCKYYIILYGEEAQKYIIENLNQIIDRNNAICDSFADKGE